MNATSTTALSAMASIGALALTTTLAEPTAEAQEQNFLRQSSVTAVGGFGVSDYTRNVDSGLIGLELSTGAIQKKSTAGPFAVYMRPIVPINFTFGPAGYDIKQEDQNGVKTKIDGGENYAFRAGAGAVFGLGVQSQNEGYEDWSVGLQFALSLNGGYSVLESPLTASEESGLFGAQGTLRIGGKYHNWGFGFGLTTFANFVGKSPSASFLNPDSFQGHDFNGLGTPYQFTFAITRYFKDYSQQPQ